MVRRSQDSIEDVWSRPNWPPRVEKIFVDSLIEEMKYNGDVIPSGFKDQSWENVVKDFNQYSGFNFDKAELKKHLSVLRKRYRIVKPLYNHGGFGWDARTKMVVVDDAVWAEYIEAHPKITPYRQYGCPIYEEMCHIFTKPKATGQHAVSAGGYTSKSSGQKKRKSTEPPESVPNKKNSVVGPDNAKEINACGVDLNQNQNNDPYSTANAIAAVNATPGVELSLFNAALELFENETWRKTFVTMKTEKRLGWLKAMIPKKR